MKSFPQYHHARSLRRKVMRMKILRRQTGWLHSIGLHFPTLAIQHVAKEVSDVVSSEERRLHIWRIVLPILFRLQKGPTLSV